MKQMNVTSKSIVGGKLLTVCAAAHSPNRNRWWQAPDRLCSGAQPEQAAGGEQKP